eukprot:s691_g16.t1
MVFQYHGAAAEVTCLWLTRIEFLGSSLAFSSDLAIAGHREPVDTFCRNPLASCSDLKSEWRDKDGARCQEYEEKSWCNADGSYGSGWRSSWGAFSDYSFGGSDVSTICCACGGGVRSPPPVTVTACDQNLAAIDMDCDGTIDCSDACPLDPQPQCTTVTTSTTPPEGLAMRMMHHDAQYLLLCQSLPCFFAFLHTSSCFTCFTIFCELLWHLDHALQFYDHAACVQSNFACYFLAPRAVLKRRLGR